MCLAFHPSNNPLREVLLLSQILEMRKQSPRGEVTYLKPHAKDLTPKRLAPMLVVSFLRSFHVEKRFSHANCLGS